MSKQKTEPDHIYGIVPAEELETGPNSAGQSGDIQGLSGETEGSSESVLELLEEGQYLEAQIVDGIENAPEAGVAEVRTKQLKEDDVPQEYLDGD